MIQWARRGLIVPTSVHLLRFREPSVRLGKPIDPQVVPFRGLYLESYKVIPKRNYLGAYAKLQDSPAVFCTWFQVLGAVLVPSGHASRSSKHELLGSVRVGAKGFHGLGFWPNRQRV